VRAAALEDFDGFDNFIGVAGHAAERLVHGGEQGDALFAHAASGVDHDFGKADGIFFLGHEGAGAGFDVEHERIDALGELLAHDRGANEADVFNGGGDVTQGVDFLVSGGDFGSLADETEAALFEDAAEIGEREGSVKAGNGFKFVQGAAGVAEAAAADHGDGESSRGDDRGEDEGGFVANAAGGVLVHLFHGQVEMIDDFAGVQHHFGEGGDLGVGEATNPGGHEPGGHLIIGDFALGVAGDEESDFFAGVLPGIAFLTDEVDSTHAIGTNSETSIGAKRRQRNGAERSCIGRRLPESSHLLKPACCYNFALAT